VQRRCPNSPAAAIERARASNADSVKHSLEAQLNQERKRLKLAEQATKAQFDSAAHEWEAFKKHKKGQAGGSALATLLRCQPQPYTGDAEIIGPAGGTIHFGRNSLVIPKGALSEPTVITGEQPTGTIVEAQFSPHGLLFNQSSTLTISYGVSCRRCRRTSSSTSVRDISCWNSNRRRTTSR
jgi:hypothetical protein